jgi:hypothetical protein
MKTVALESILDDIPLRSERQETHVSSNDIIGFFRLVCDVSSDWNYRKSPLSNSGMLIFRPVLFSQTFGEHISKSFLWFAVIPSSLLGNSAVNTLT